MQNNEKKDWDWLASAGVDSQTQSKARQLFKQYRIDGTLLDFLASEDGLKLLAAHKAAASSTTRSSEPDLSKSSRQLRGRQKISAQERQGQGHYFDLPTPERNSKSQSSQPAVSNGDTNRLRKAGLVLEEAAKAGPRRQEEAGAWHDGCIKSFNEETGYGFIAVAAGVGGGQDIFYHRKELPATGGPPEPGWVCSFLLTTDKQGRQRACQIRWLHPDSEDVQSPGRPMEAKRSADVERSSCDTASVNDTNFNGARFCGEIKSRGASYGFICCDSEVFSGQDIFVQKATLEQLGPGSGAISFEVFFSSKGQPQA
eukprot:TRINITY_DN73995_c0_g1_i1.p1 TRINITY_DN73995_c0_g1~~TRINITY_DN73995_c0_g1_i1.p1  ORF type:complete len:313 (-),score=61.98 TRINITY_DN73995_c0_g1_i1:122-1060(-)